MVLSFSWCEVWFCPFLGGGWVGGRGVVLSFTWKRGCFVFSHGKEEGGRVVLSKTWRGGLFCLFLGGRRGCLVLFLVRRMLSLFLGEERGGVVLSFFRVIGGLSHSGWGSNAREGLIQREFWGLGSIPT